MVRISALFSPTFATQSPCVTILWAWQTSLGRQDRGFSGGCTALLEERGYLRWLICKGAGV